MEIRHKNKNLQEIQQILKNYIDGKGVRLSPVFVRIADGNLFAGIFLSNLLFWTNKSPNDGWVFKSSKQLDSETCLNRRQQETARKVLLKIHLIEQKRMGARGVMHYRLNNHLFLQKLKGDQGFNRVDAFIDKYQEGDTNDSSAISQNRSTNQASRRGRVPARRSG